MERKLLSNGYSVLKHPIIVYFFIISCCNQGIYTVITFYLLEYHQINGLNLIGSIATILSIFGMSFILDLKKRIIKNFLLIGGILQIILVFFIGVFFLRDPFIAGVLMIFTAIFSGSIGLFVLSRALRNQPFMKRTQNCALVFAAWFAGITLFGVIFHFNIELAFLFSTITGIIGYFGYYGLITDEETTQESSQSNLPLRDIFTPNNLSVIILLWLYFSTFGAFLIYFAFYLQNSAIIDHNFYGMSWTIATGLDILVAVIMAIINHRMSLRITFSIGYVIAGSLTLLMILDSSFIPVTFFLWAPFWPILFTYTLVNIGDTYPDSQNSQIVALWYISLASGIGIGMFLPTMITNQITLLASLLFLMVLSNIFLSYLDKLKAPMTIYYLMIFKADTSLVVYSKGYLAFDENILSGVLSAVTTMFKESLSTTQGLQAIDHGDKKLLIHQTALLCGVLITNRVDNASLQKLKDILELFEVAFFKQLKSPLINQNDFRQLPPLLELRINQLKKRNISNIN